MATDRDLEVAPGVRLSARTYNARIPGPTLRCTQGDLLRVRFVNGSAHPHTMLFHGINTAEMDGVPMVGRGVTAEADADARRTSGDTTGPAPERPLAATPGWTERLPLWVLASAAAVVVAAVLIALALVGRFAARPERAGDRAGRGGAHCAASRSDPDFAAGFDGSLIP